MSNLIEHFGNLPDPRVRGRTDYPLIEIIFLSISAIISGFDGWEAIEDFGHGKLDWLRKSYLMKTVYPVMIRLRVLCLVYRQRRYNHVL